MIDTTTERLHKQTQRNIDYIRNNTYSTCINGTEINRKQKWKEKQLYGHFTRQSNEFSSRKCGHG